MRIGEGRCGRGVGSAEDDIDRAAGGVVHGKEVILGVVVIECYDYAGELDEANGVVEVIDWEGVLVGEIFCCTGWEGSSGTGV